MNLPPEETKHCSKNPMENNSDKVDNREASSLDRGNPLTGHR